MDIDKILKLAYIKIENYNWIEEGNTVYGLIFDVNIPNSCKYNGIIDMQTQTVKGEIIKLYKFKSSTVGTLGKYLTSRKILDAIENALKRKSKFPIINYNESWKYLITFSIPNSTKRSNLNELVERIIDGSPVNSILFTEYLIEDKAKLDYTIIRKFSIFLKDIKTNSVFREFIENYYDS